MKHSPMRYITFVFTLLVFSIGFISCKKDDSSSSTVNNQQLNQGRWKVVYFYDRKDETYKFSGYTFEFLSSGVLKAYLPGGSVVAGTWQTASGGSKLLFNISGTEALDEMVDDWRVQLQSNDQLKLNNISGGDGHEEQLHFEKE